MTAQTVRNEIERQSIAKVKAKGGKGFCITETDADRIKTAILDRRQSQSQSQSEQKPKQKDDLLLLLQQELEAKNEQIRQLTLTVKEQAENITALTAALENTTTSLKAAQALHAGTMQERIEDKQEKKWWQFWK